MILTLTTKEQRARPGEERQTMCDVRGGGGDILPGFADVLFQLIEGCDAQFPLHFSNLLLFGCQNLGQSLDLILYLDTHGTVADRHVGYGITSSSYIKQYCTATVCTQLRPVFLYRI